MTFAPPDPEALVELLTAGPGILVAVNAEKIASADPTIVALAAAHVGYPDGIGAVLALRRLGMRAHRIAGADMWLRVVERYAGQRSFYLVGGTEEVATAVAERLSAKYPGLQLHFRNGFLGPGDPERLQHDLRTYRPDFVFVAMGSPRQEMLIERLYRAQPATYVGLGGSFDVYAGKKSRAPLWLRRTGLEWAYRLATEPARLRHVGALVRFATMLGTGRF